MNDYQRNKQLSAGNDDSKKQHTSTDEINLLHCINIQNNFCNDVNDVHV